MNDLIILATVNAKRELYAATANEFAAAAPNIHLALLSEYLRAGGLRVETIESDIEGLSMTQLADIVRQKAPRLLGIISTGSNPASSTMTMVGAITFFDIFNADKAGVSTFIWGPHPTVLPERTLKETQADFVVRGEGWDTITALYRALNDAKARIDDIPGLSFMDEKNIYHTTPDATLRQDLDSLPMIDWTRFPPTRYKAHNWHCFGELEERSPYAIVWASFGCPFQCTFCSINNLFGKRTQRFRSIKKVVEEISVLVEKHGVRHIKMLDELFVVNADRMNEFCDRLETKNYDINMWAYARVDTVTPKLLKRLKKVGMNWLSYGFETSTPEMLKATRKGSHMIDHDAVIQMTKEAGINICADVVFGLPEETHATMEHTYEFLVRHNFEYVNMYPVFAYPGTVLFDETPSPKSWEEYALYGYECRPMPGKNLSAEEILRFRDEAFLRYHSRPEYLTMIETKFGKATREHIERMVAVPLKRRIIEEAEQ